jgi:hypothetical protein
MELGYVKECVVRDVTGGGHGLIDDSVCVLFLPSTAEEG